MQIVTGKGALTWDSFIYRFEWTASRRCWDETKKTSRLFDYLSDGALEFGRRAGSGRRYQELRRLPMHRFSRKEEPSSARRQFQYIMQLETETLEEYAERVHFLALDGFCNNSGDIVDQIGTEAFLLGCREKEAARYVIERNSRTINEALKWIKASMANHSAIYGSRSPVPLAGNFQSSSSNIC